MASLSQTAGKGPLPGWLSALPGRLHKSSDAALALGVLAMIGLMILPVPSWLLDLFLTLNVAASAVLLMAAVLTPSGTRIYTFPTLLILATLFRLGLDVCSTRLILTEAEAGEVIQSFGQFAAGGSVIVGLVVFLIITLVQLIVISKGAERTANANAVFVRESIPGRQMAMDADAAAQRITPAQLARERQQMKVEVEFYGRMYGAMEFIKADPIAGIVVAAINIVAGLYVGIRENNMALGQTVERYTLLTVGAGLVSQIPAMVGSVAGTILVSRVSSDDSTEGLGHTAAGQFFALPKAMILASVMLVVLAVIPGMPTVPFLVLAGFVGSLGYHFHKRAGISVEGGDGQADLFRPSAHMEVRLPALWEQDVSDTHRRVASLLKQMGDVLGIPFPAWSLRQGVNHAPDRIAVFRGGREIASEPEWTRLEPKLKEDMLLYPGKYFGLDEAYRWLDIAARGNEYAARLLRIRLQSAPTQAGPEPLYNFLRLLVEERVPINLTWDILNLLVAKSPGNLVGTDENRLDLADHVRQQLCENSARSYREHYWKAGPSRCFEIYPDSQVLPDLEMRSRSNAPPEAHKRIEAWLLKILPPENKHETSIIVTASRQRRLLWEVAEGLFQRGELYRPVLVLMPEEMKPAALQDIAREKV